MTSEPNEHEKLRKHGADDLAARRSLAGGPDGIGGHHNGDHHNGGVPAGRIPDVDRRRAERVGTGQPDDEYLLTAYLFGDISPAGREEVERRLEESEELRAELEKLRSTKLLIEDALKGPFEDAEDGNDEEHGAGSGRKVDPRELAALLHERRRSRRMKTAISWLSVAATVVICGTFFLQGITSSRRGVDMYAVRSAPETAGGAVAGDELAYAPEDPARTTAAWGEPASDPHRYFAGKGAGDAVSASKDKSSKSSRSDLNESYEYKLANKKAEAADADFDGRLAQRESITSRRNRGARQLVVPETESEAVRSFESQALRMKKEVAPADSPQQIVDHAEITEQARRQVWNFAPDLDISEFRAPSVTEPPAPPTTGTPGRLGGSTAVRELSAAIPDSRPEPAKPASPLAGRKIAENRPAEEPAPVTRLDRLEKNVAGELDDLTDEDLALAQTEMVLEGGASEDREVEEGRIDDYRMQRRASEIGQIADQIDGVAELPEESRRRDGNAPLKRPADPPAEAGAAQERDRWGREYAQQLAPEQQAAQEAARQAGDRNGLWNVPQNVEAVRGELAQQARQIDTEPDEQLRLDIERQLRELGRSRSSESEVLRVGASGLASRDREGTPAGASPFGDAKQDATAPGSPVPDASGVYAGGKLQRDIQSFARGGGQAPDAGGAAGGAGGYILPERASQLADLVNRQQAELFGQGPGAFGPGDGQPAVNFRLRSESPGADGAASGWSDWLSRLDAGYENAQREIAPLEKELRAYVHYRSLDRDLTLETYSAQPLDVPPPAIGDENLGQEGFRERYGVNPFVDTRHDHFSTFSMDVDTASFTRSRERIRSGQLPDPEAVRVEEFVNYFPQDCAPDPEAAFSVCTEGGPSPFGAGLDLLKITVKARELRPNERKSAVLTFAIDTSGSMHMQNSLDLMRNALKALVESLRADDQVAVVAYNANAYVVLPHTPAREKERIFDALDSLRAGGGTNVEGGLDLAYRLADEVHQPKAVNRVVLCSDGVANVGARDPKDVVEKVKVFAGRGIYLSVVGFGTRRYNDSFLERLAGQGNGNYTYVANLDEARAVFQRNLPATLQVLAEDAKIQLDFNPEVVTHYRLLGYENRDIADEDFRNDQVDAAEVGPGTTVTVLYEIHRRPGSHGDLGRLFIRYRDTGTRRVDELDFNLPPGVLETRLESATPEFRFTACAAETAELLRDSYWARNGSFGSVLDQLYGLEESFRARPEWRELAQLVTEAQRLLVIRLASSAQNDPAE